MEKEYKVKNVKVFNKNKQDAKYRYDLNLASHDAWEKFAYDLIESDFGEKKAQKLKDTIAVVVNLDDPKDFQVADSLVANVKMTTAGKVYHVRTYTFEAFGETTDYRSKASEIWNSRIMSEVVEKQKTKSVGD